MRGRTRLGPTHDPRAPPPATAPSTTAHGSAADPTPAAATVRYPTAGRTRPTCPGRVGCGVQRADPQPTRPGRRCQRPARLITPPQPATGGPPNAQLSRGGGSGGYRFRTSRHAPAVGCSGWFGGCGAGGTRPHPGRPPPSGGPTAAPPAWRPRPPGTRHRREPRGRSRTRVWCARRAVSHPVRVRGGRSRQRTENPAARKPRTKRMCEISRHASTAGGLLPPNTQLSSGGGHVRYEPQKTCIPPPSAAATGSASSLHLSEHSRHIYLTSTSPARISTPIMTDAPPRPKNIIGNIQK